MEEAQELEGGAHRSVGWRGPCFYRSLLPFLASPSLVMDPLTLGNSFASIPSVDDESSTTPAGLQSPAKGQRARRGSVGSIVGSPYEETFPLDFQPPQPERFKVRLLKFGD